MDKLQINSPVEISGLSESIPYIEMTTRLCWLDYPNLNGVGLSSDAEESFKTLIGMPVVARINSAGTKFGSHEVTIDDNGEIKFNTSAYGVHTDVWVAEDEVEIPNIGLKRVPCLFAKSKVWKRFSSVVKLIANKLENPESFNGGLWSSWELQGNEYQLNENEEKVYTSFTFLSNCLIDVPPAYSTTSKTIAVASSKFETELSSAYLDDLGKYQDFDKCPEALLNITNSNKEDKLMPDNKMVVSALTTRDLHQKANEALNPKGWNSSPYYSIWEVYPTEQKLLAYDVDRTSDDEYLVFTYTVSEDSISVGEGVQTKLSKILSEKTNININLSLDETARLLSEKETNIKRLELEKESLTSQLNEKIDALVSVSEKVEQLQASLEDLLPFKYQIEEIKRLEQEEKLAQQKEELKDFATKGGMISKEELETSEELKAMIDELNLSAIKNVIADRFLRKIEEAPLAFETSQTKYKETNNVKTNIDSGDSVVDYKSTMLSFLRNN